jgi:CTP synthase (UTP-ammonia lyase)
MLASVRIGILGDFNPEFHSHHATNACIEHASAATNLPVLTEWVPTPSINEQTLAGYDGLWASPGSPYKSFEGMLRGIEFARRRDRPFVGT